MQNKLLIPISIVLAGIIIAGAFVYINQGKIQISSRKELSAQEAAQKAVDYINKNKDRVAGGLSASLINVSEEGNVYKIHLKVGDGEYDSYVTKDGKLLFPQGYNLEEESKKETKNETESPSQIPKSDKPNVKLFVMSYCPYGLQAEKMFLPVYDLLKNKTEMGVYFVNYIMHEKKEIDENLRQYCIQKEEKEKYSSYLNCFVKEGNFEKCLSEAKINTSKLQNCIFETDRDFNITALYRNKDTWLNGRYPKFPIYDNLNEKYGVRGSPTIVINDQIVNISPRSSEKFKEIICQAFNSPPEECSQTLSNEVPSPGIGGGNGSSSGGQCK
jgi:hypothetical protein